MELLHRAGRRKKKKNTVLLLLLLLENVIVKRKCAAGNVGAKKALKGYIIIWRTFFSQRLKICKQ